MLNLLLKQLELLLIINTNNYFQKLIKRMNKAQIIYNQFHNAFQYYENLIGNFEDTYFNKHESIDIDEMSKYKSYKHIYIVM